MQAKVLLHSPSGQCEHQLAPIKLAPTDYNGMTGSTFAVLDRKVVACYGYMAYNCYIYDVASDAWSVYGTYSPQNNYGSRGVYHQGKLYQYDPRVPHVFDPVQKSFSSWALPPLPAGHTEAYYACYVSWNSSIMRLGADGAPSLRRQVHSYDPATNSWSNQPISSSVPFEIFQTGCVVLPNGNVLVTGTSKTGWPNQPNNYAEYNVTANTWSPLMQGNSSSSFVKSLPLVLGNRVFVLPNGNDMPVYEYIYTNSTMVAAPYKYPASGWMSPAATVVPASWFSHLTGGCTGVY